METPEEFPAPLAWDSSGEPFDPPPKALFWRVRRVLPRGGLQTINAGMRPLLLKVSASEDDATGALVDVGAPNGRYRLDPVDGHGRVCGPIHAIVNFQRPVGLDCGDGDEEGSGGNGDRQVIDRLLSTIKELAQANASTTARIGEAIAVNANHGNSNNMGSVFEAFARLVSLANDSATREPHEIVLQQPGEAPPESRASVAEQALGALVPVFGPKVGELVDAIITRVKTSPTSAHAPPGWMQPRNGIAPFPSVTWPPPPAFRFAQANAPSTAEPTQPTATDAGTVNVPSTRPEGDNS